MHPSRTTRSRRPATPQQGLDEQGTIPEEEGDAPPIELDLGGEDQEERTPEDGEGVPSSSNKFRFWLSMTPDEREYLKQNRQKAKRGTKNGGRLPSAKRQEIGPDRQRKGSVLDQSWGPEYQSNEHWKDIWDQTHAGAQEWPGGVQIQRDTLDYMGTLCVPETFTTGILAEFHVASGHVGVERMLKEMAHRFIFAPGEPITEITKEVRRGCAVFQACDHPTWKAKGPIGCNPVPERLMASVYLDVFDLPEQQW